jgi:hypothetical protein
MSADNWETWQSVPVARVGTIEKVIRPITEQPAWIYYTTEADRTNCDIFSSHAAAIDHAERQFIRKRIDMLMSVNCD